MKKRLLIFFISLIIIHTASATIILNDFKNPVYNRGEELSVSGILRDTTVDSGSMEFKLICDDLAFDLTSLATIIEEETVFSTQPFNLPPTAEGTCYIKASLVYGGAIVEQKDSDSFNVSDELKAYGNDFQVNPMQVQLGKSINIYGYITNINDEPITGLATIYFTNENKTYYVNNIDVIEGKLDYEYPTVNNKPGSYAIAVHVTDIYGNKKLFENIATFNIIDEISIFIEPIQRKILPGSTINLAGRLNNILGEKMQEGKVQIVLKDEIFNIDLENGEFNYDLKIPENIETGKQVLIVSFVSQNTGNWGSTTRTINIQAIATELKLNTADSVKPENILDIVVYLYDQSNNIIEDNVVIEVIDPDGEMIFLDYYESGEKSGVDIPQYAIPGEWMLKAKYQDIEAEQGFIVEEVKDLALEIINDTLSIKNVGNVDYDERISIYLDDGGFILTKKISLEPEAKTTINLTEETPSGQYDIKITGNAIADSRFDDVIIVGKAKRSLNFIYSFLLLCIMASLIYNIVFKKKYIQNVYTRNIRESRAATINLRNLRARKKEKKVEKPTFSKEENIADFKERILKDIRETEDKINSKVKEKKPISAFSSSPEPSKETKSEEKKDDEPSGLFNMFN